MSGRYSELYRRTREALEAEAESQLQRPLTIHERNLFRSCGTLTRLESLGMLVYYAENAAELAAKLAETSMDSRFLLAVKETQDRVEKRLQRFLSSTERQQLQALGNIEELWTLEEQLNEAAPDQRESVLLALLSVPQST